MYRAQETPLRSPDIAHQDTRIMRIYIKESVTSLWGTYRDYKTVSNPFPSFIYDLHQKVQRREGYNCEKYSSEAPKTLTVVLSMLEE